MSTSSPAFAPSSARPTGESGETPPTLEISTSSRPPCSSSSSTLEPTPTVSAAAAAPARVGGGRVLVDEHGAREPVAQHPDPPLEQALLVLGGVVLEVLGEVAEG